MAKEQLSVSEMKKIAHEIIEEELGKSNVELNFFPVTFIEYYNDYIFKKQFKLSERIGFSTVPLFYKGGFRINAMNDIIIFLHYTNKTKLIGRNIFKLVENCYHEARHVEQDSFNVYSYEGFLIDLENYISNQGFDMGYALHHDNYFVEIDAHLYGFSKAKEYMISHYFELYEEQKDYIDGLEKRYNLDYLTYDMVSVVERVIELRKKRYNSYGSMIHMPMVLDMYLSEDFPAVMDVFLNYNCTFKKVSNIVNDARFKKIDKRIISAIFSCKYFLESVDVDSLSYEELIVVNEAWVYTSDVYQKQVELAEKSYKERSVSFKDYLNLQKYLLGKMNVVKNFLRQPKMVTSVKKG